MLVFNKELVQAFVAMGGEPSGKGSISTDKLKQIIKKDFEMTIDIEVLCCANPNRD